MVGGGGSGEQQQQRKEKWKERNRGTQSHGFPFPNGESAELGSESADTGFYLYSQIFKNKHYLLDVLLLFI